MDLLSSTWLSGRKRDGTTAPLSPLHMGDVALIDLAAPRPDFRGALFQFLIGLLQVAYGPRDMEEWTERFANPPDAQALEAALAPYRHAFLLENDGGPAFMQDLALPPDANQLPVLDLLIDAGSSSNLYFNKPQSAHGLCEGCFAQALLTLQLNAPSGGRGVRTSLRGGGPLTTLLQPADDEASLWQRLWLNVLPLDALMYPPVKALGDVLPWMTHTRTSDDKSGMETRPATGAETLDAHEFVHPLQAWWSMSRRIRMCAETAEQGDCAICGAAGVRLIRHYRTRHGGTNYTGNWMHPLTPYNLDIKGQESPISCKGHQAGRGYRDWLGLVLGNEDHQPKPAQVVSHVVAKLPRLHTRLWCFGYATDNMKAKCWYDSTLPVHVLQPDVLPRTFAKHVKHILDSAEGMAKALSARVKDARGYADPVVSQSFWQQSEPTFYAVLEQLAALDFESLAALAPVYRQWLRQTRGQVLALFDDWVLSSPMDDLNMKRVVQARANLGKELNSGKAMKPLWELVNRHHKEPA